MPLLEQLLLPASPASLYPLFLGENSLRMSKIINVAVFIFTWLLALGNASATVVNFDDLPAGLVPDGYAGLTWGTSTLSQPYAESASFSVYGSLTYSTPHSAPKFILNNYGVPDLWFAFPFPVNFKGAWVAAPLNNSLAAQKIRFVDDRGQTTDWLDLTSTPQYLAANFNDSKKIFVQPTGIYAGVPSNGGWYAMDDITYDAISTPTRVLSTDVSGTGNGSINSNPSGLIYCTYSPQIGTCEATVQQYSQITLYADPSTDSSFNGWGEACSGCVGPFCTITLDTDKTCSASFSILPLIRLNAVYFASIQKAYDHMADGTQATMQIQAVEFQENIELRHDISLRLMGGYDSNFIDSNGYTIVHGALLISKGSVVVDKLLQR